MVARSSASLPASKLPRRARGEPNQQRGSRKRHLRPRAERNCQAFSAASSTSIHTHLLELGMESLFRHGKDLAKTGLKKSAAAAKGPFRKASGPVTPSQ